MARQILISFEDPWYVAVDLATDIASQGKTINEAKANLREALELYFEDNKIPDNPSEYYLGVLEVM